MNSKLFDSLKNGIFEGLESCPGVSQNIVECTGGNRAI